ncbi:MAG: 4Fe-4S binding protein [Phycisphaerae bacterium]
MIREIVSIDEELCNGCGKCVPACAEGALKIVNGKARIVSDVLCDGLGACLGNCPQGAIKIERRDAVPFDEAAVERHLASSNGTGAHPGIHVHRNGPQNGEDVAGTGGHAGCPSSRFVQFAGRPAGAAGTSGGSDGAEVAPPPSELTHWPVQLRLLSPAAPALHGARLLVAADCVPVAFAGFHSELLRDRAVVIACPKLDDPQGYVEKLAEMFQHNDLAEITVAHMEVPCCSGILQMVLTARQLSGRNLTVNDVVIGVQGEIIARRQIPSESAISANGPSTTCHSKGVR